MVQTEQSPEVDRGAYASIAEFYPFYLSQHASRTNRRLHFIGTTLVIALVVAAFWSANYLLLLLVPLAGYGFAWFGHLVFEKNKPATFKYPFYSLACDFVMYRDLLLGRIKL